MRGLTALFQLQRSPARGAGRDRTRSLSRPGVTRASTEPGAGRRERLANAAVNTVLAASLQRSPARGAGRDGDEPRGHGEVPRASTEPGAGRRERLVVLLLLRTWHRRFNGARRGAPGETPAPSSARACARRFNGARRGAPGETGAPHLPAVTPSRLQRSPARGAGRDQVATMIIGGLKAMGLQRSPARGAGRDWRISNRFQKQHPASTEPGAGRRERLLGLVGGEEDQQRASTEPGAGRRERLGPSGVFRFASNALLQRSPARGAGRDFLSM